MESSAPEQTEQPSTYPAQSTTPESRHVDSEPARQTTPVKENADRGKQVLVPENQEWKKLMAYAGPGFLVAIAYIDPGNFQSDLQAGASYKYELLWVLLWASLSGWLIQSLAANLGVVTGKHLAEHCRAEYPKHVSRALWVVAEIAIVASDIPEVIGTAFALNMLFGIEVWIGVILTGFSTLILLSLQVFGVRKLEMLISLFVFTIAACFFVELGYSKPKVTEVLLGLAIPRLKDTEATAIAISLVGCVVMPHNLYLHSALVLSRKVPRTTRGIMDGRLYNRIECSLALVLAFAINVSVITVSGTICSRPDLPQKYKHSCKNLDLNEAPFLLKNVLGGASSKLFAVALLASGQSSTITGTYAGQFVMQGFLDIRVRPWLRNLLTRSVAIVPSLFVAIIGGSRGAGRLIIISSMLLSFELPFALLPLLKFTSSRMKMGTFINPRWVSVLTWVVGGCVCVANIYYLASSTIKKIVHMQLALKIVLGILVAVFILLYISCIVFLAIRKDVHDTFSPPDDECIRDVEKIQVAAQGKDKSDEEGAAAGRSGAREDIAQMQLPGDLHSGQAI